MRLIFLGTSSGKPSKDRNVSCIALETFDSKIYLFDCGEGTQHQFLKSRLRITHIEAIFITHLHGDHIFGLPGLLCSLSESRIKPLKIYGPNGLKEYLIVSLKYNKPSFKLEIIEINTTPHVFNINNFIITINELVHIKNITCFGYVLKEKDKLGKLKPNEILKDIEKIEDEKIFTLLKDNNILSKNRKSLLRLLQNGKIIYFEDFFIDPNNSKYSEPKRIGKKICILGDTCNPKNIIENAMNCDILVHEATNAFISENIPYNDFIKKTLIHGHSTPEMAGEIGKLCNAKKMVLTHFSNRYSTFDQEVLDQIKKMAIEKYGKDELYLAYDFFDLEV